MIGTPPWRHAHDTKYAHHGPGPGEPAVAWRYWAIRGESFEPGGCSAWPTSPAAAATIAVPLPPPAIGAVGLTVPTEPGPTAVWSIPANELPLAPPACLGAGGAGGAKAVSRAEMRARTASKLTCVGIGALPPQLEGTQKGRPRERDRPLMRFNRQTELAEQGQHSLRRLVRLGQHRGAGLLQDL